MAQSTAPARLMSASGGRRSGGHRGRGPLGAAPCGFRPQSGIHLPPPPLDRHEPILLLSVTGPAPAGTSLGGMGQLDHASRPGGRVDGFGTRTAVASPATSQRVRPASRRWARVRPRGRAVAGGGTERCDCPEDQGVAGVGGATRWESIGHEPPRRRPAECQPDVGPILNPYAVLYPGMTHRLGCSRDRAVSGSSAVVLEAIRLSIEDAAHTPVTRDLSASRPAMIQAWIENGCPEDGSDA
jgi:hypothetical protein